MVWLAIIWFTWDSFCTDLINECANKADESISDNDRWPANACGDLMANCSFVGENFGEELQKELETKNNRNYYISDSCNGVEALNCINKLDSPSNSPSNKYLNDMSNKHAFNELNQSFEDWKNIKLWFRGMGSQVFDLIKFQMDNTEVSRENYIFSNKRNS